MKKAAFGLCVLLAVACGAPKQATKPESIGYNGYYTNGHGYDRSHGIVVAWSGPSSSCACDCKAWDYALGLTLTAASQQEYLRRQCEIACTGICQE